MFALKFFKKKEEPSKQNQIEDNPETTIISASNTDELLSKIIGQGRVSIHELLAPSFIDRSESDYIRVGRYFCKSLMITGLPRMVEVGTVLDPFLRHNGDIDFCVHVVPYDEREALDELVKIATRLKAEYTGAAKRGDESLSQELETAYRDAMGIRGSIATNTSKLFAVNIVANLFDTDLGRLKESADLLEGQLDMRSIYSRYADGRMDEGFLSGGPLGINLTLDTHRNLDSYAASTLFPFITADLKHKNGFPFAINYFTAAPIFFDPYDPTLDNHNSFVIAGSGKGKSTLCKTFLNRALYIHELACVVDPMGEWGGVARKRGGICLKIGPGTSDFINPCDIAEEYNPATDSYYVNLDDKITDMTRLVETMCTTLEPDEASFVESVWVEVYRQKFGFSENPNSIYEEKHDVNDGRVVSGKFIKPMPRLRDFYETAKIKAKDNERYQRILTIVERYLEGKPLGFFDCYTNVNLEGKPVIVFDVSPLKDTGDARTIGMQAVLNWIEQHFIKKDRNQKGRVYLDEAWTFVRGKTALLTMSFLEALYRRARHHKKGITAISQDFQIFVRHEQGQAIFQNSDTYIFLNNKKAEVEEMRNFFGLSEGELAFISNAGVGEGIMRVKDTSVAFKIINTPSESEVVYSTKRRLAEDE